MIPRLFAVFALLRVKPAQVARASGIRANTLNQLKKTGRDPDSISAITLAAIIRAYPQIDAHYILTGEGKPLRALGVDLEQIKETLTDMHDQLGRVLTEQLPKTDRYGMIEERGLKKALLVRQGK